MIMEEKSVNNSKTKKLVMAALLAALCCVATMIIKIPSPLKGYLNLGDCVVLLSGWLLSPVYGFLAAGVGSALADIFSGYVTYAPATFVIKGLMALAAYGLFKLISIKKTYISRVVGAVVAEIIMIGGYYFVEATFLGYGFGGALASVPGNAVQAVFGIVSGIIITEVLLNIKATKRFLEK